MPFVSFASLKEYMEQLLPKLGLPQADAAVMSQIYIDTTKRGMGHHDINMLPMRLKALRSGAINPNPHFQRLSGFGGMERWDGDNGPGEVINHFSMRRAIDLAAQHGMGLCAVRNSNHYLCCAPYVAQAAQQGCIGLIISKGVPTMGVPGAKGCVVGQSPIGFAFPTREDWPVMLDISLAYTSGLQLFQRAKQGVSVPPWWGVDENGEATTDPDKLLRGVRYPIGEHKGFGLAILCELLTGVLSGGLILDQDEDMEGMAARSTAHTAIAIKADALMDRETYLERSTDLIHRIQARADGVRLPGQSSWSKRQVLEAQGSVQLSQLLWDELNKYARDCGTVQLTDCAPQEKE